jgi:DNA-binding transcriptional LysR family regulator
MNETKLIDLKMLRSFLAVARLRNFTLAARELGITQPAVSIHVRKLEAVLGCRLVDATSREVNLTDEGRALVESGPGVLAAVSNVRRRIELAGAKRRGRLRIGASSAPGAWLLPRMLSEFRRSHPDVELSCTIRDTLLVEEMLLAGDLDCALVGGHLAQRNVDLQPIADDRLVIVAPVDHPLCGRRKVHVEDLAGERFVMREAGSATRRLLDAWLLHQGTEPQVALEVDSPEAVKAMVAAGLGIAAISAFTLPRDAGAEGLCVLATDLSLKRQLSLAIPADRRDLPHVAAFAETVRRVGAGEPPGRRGRSRGRTRTRGAVTGRA